MASMKPQEYTAFTLDYLFHNYKYIKRKLTALEMRKVAQRRIAERLVSMGLESKGLDGLLEDDGSTIPVDQPLMTPRGITLMLTSEKTTILGMRDSATDAEQSKDAGTEAAAATGAAMAQRPDLDEGDSNNSNSSCELCGQIAIFNGYACRICPKRYHAECLEKENEMQENEVYLMVTLGARGLWSCHDCCNLEPFLRENELAVVRRKFNKIDKDGDGSLTIEEFLKHKSTIFGKQEGHAQMLVDMGGLIKQFHDADLDRDGELSWVEFVTNEAKKYLPGRDPKDLVGKLTAKEIATARAAYQKKVGMNTITDVWTDEREEECKAYTKSNAVAIILSRANKWPEKPDHITRHPSFCSEYIRASEHQSTAADDDQSQ